MSLIFPAIDNLIKLRNKNMKFTNDWFTPHKSAWDKLITRYNPQKILEIGAFEGQSICFLIDLIGKNQNLEIYCLDTWAGGQEHSDYDMPAVEKLFDENIREAIQSSDQQHKIFKLKGDSSLGLSSLISEGKTNYFDMIYIDGSHEAPDVFSDAALSYRLLRNGGLMIFDDYVWGGGINADPIMNPKMAIDSFLNCYQRKVQPIPWMPLCQMYCQKLN